MTPLDAGRCTRPSSKCCAGTCNAQLGEKKERRRTSHIPHQNRPPLQQTQALRSSPHQTSNIGTHDFVTRSSDHPQTHGCPRRMFHKWVARQQQRLSKPRTKVAKKGRQDPRRMALLSHRPRWRREWVILYSFNGWHEGEGGGEDLNMAASGKTSWATKDLYKHHFRFA